MNKEQINQLIQEGVIPDSQEKNELIETHISWIILGREFAYKIKKPVQYSFLDFSSLDKRKFYCEREIELNKRLTQGVYLDVQVLREYKGRFVMGGVKGEPVDYAVRMNKLDRSKQMDNLLLNHQISSADLRNLALKIGSFHRNTETISQKDLSDIQNKFNDLGKELDYLKKVNRENYCGMIETAIGISEQFNSINKTVFERRLKAGWIRDCHGDLHCRNIFFLPDPQPFDCIEFNDDYRQIDVLNEIAFLCMDLDFFDREDLSEYFVQEYIRVNPAISTEKDLQLFYYFKSYRANIRAKINSLRSGSAENSTDRDRYLEDTGKYLRLMTRYMGKLSL